MFNNLSCQYGYCEFESGTWQVRATLFLINFNSWLPYRRSVILSRHCDFLHQYTRTVKKQHNSAEVSFNTNKSIHLPNFRVFAHYNDDYERLLNVQRHIDMHIQDENMFM